MAKISSIRKIIVEDFSADMRDLITKLASVLNPFLDQVSSALGQQLTHRDNLKSKTYELALAAGVSTMAVAWDLNEKPTAVTIGNLTKDDMTAPSAAFCLSSYYANGKIQLTFIGLDAGTAHKTTINAVV